MHSSTSTCSRGAAVPYSWSLAWAQAADQAAVLATMGERGRRKQRRMRDTDHRPESKGLSTPNPQGCSVRLQPCARHLASPGRSRATVPTAACVTTVPTGTPRIVVPPAVWCFPLSRSPVGCCSTGPRAQAAVPGSSPIAGPSPTPRSGGCSPAGARTVSARSGLCPQGIAATPVWAGARQASSIRPRSACRRIPAR